MKLYQRFKQPIDQGAHFVVGFLWVLAGDFHAPWWVAFSTLMIAAYWREVFQHNLRLYLGRGSIIDLAFFALGGLATLCL